MRMVQNSTDGNDEYMTSCPSRKMMWSLTLDEFTVSTFNHCPQIVFVGLVPNVKAVPSHSKTYSYILQIAYLLTSLLKYDDDLYTPSPCSFLHCHLGLFSVKLVCRFKNWCHRQVVIANEHVLWTEEG